MKNFIYLVLIFFIFGCQTTGKHMVDVSSPNSITIKYHGYEMFETLTDKAKLMANDHCSQFYKKAHYKGSRIRGLSTMEWHDFQCVEEPVNIKKINYDIGNALASNPANLALDDFLSCVRDKIVSLDDMMSDASTIASTIADMCNSTYYSYINIVLEKINHNDKIKDLVKKSMLKSRSIKVAPYVLIWRKIVRNGFDKSRKPSVKELPKNLFIQNVKIDI